MKRTRNCLAHLSRRLFSSFCLLFWEKFTRAMWAQVKFLDTESVSCAKKTSSEQAKKVHCDHFHKFYHSIDFRARENSGSRATSLDRTVAKEIFLWSTAKRPWNENDFHLTNRSDSKTSRAKRTFFLSPRRHVNSASKPCNCAAFCWLNKNPTFRAFYLLLFSNGPSWPLGQCVGRLFVE